MSELILPINPVEIAKPFAADLMIGGHLDNFDVDEFVRNTIVDLDFIAFKGGLLNKEYVVRSESSVLLPPVLDVEEIKGVRFEKLQFSGEFMNYTTIQTRQKVGGGSLRALCLTFDNVTLLPDSHEVEEGHLLHVPVFAVSDIDRISA